MLIRYPYAFHLLLLLLLLLSFINKQESSQSVSRAVSGQRNTVLIKKDIPPLLAPIPPPSFDGRRGRCALLLAFSHRVRIINQLLVIIISLFSFVRSFVRSFP